jgi:uncharacterized protein YcbK (DUF882 family)
VTVKAILEANHLTDPTSIRPGQSLVIPGVDSPAKHKREAREGNETRGQSRASTSGIEADVETRDRGPMETVHAVRFGEDFRIRVKDVRGHIPSSALRAFERMMRQGNATHPVDPRLVALVGIVSGHFGGKTLEVVSGFRPYSPTQYTPHSNHNFGKALDFRVRGVPNETLRDFCRTLRSAGCGYYPNSTFVHLDVRDTKAYWVDWSRPGEPPRYDNPALPGDEGAGDVPEEPASHPAGETGSEGVGPSGDARPSDTSEWPE